MSRILAVSLLCLAACAPSVAEPEGDATAAGEPVDFVDAAYVACVEQMKQHIEPTGDAPLTFRPREDVTMADEYEVMISFSAGSISGADMTEAHPLTMMTQPAGSCIAEPGTATFSRVVVNGEVVGTDVPFGN